MLEFVYATKKYGSKTVFDKVNFEIDNGDVCVITGAKKCGKTTLLEMCAGIKEIDCGDILFNGISLKEAPIKYKRNIAYIPSKPVMYDFMKGIQYLNFVSSVFKLTGRERKRIIEKYSQLFEIKDLLTDNAAFYSEEEKIRLYIVASLIHSPKLIIMDETFDKIDKKSIHNLKTILREMCNNGCTVLFSSKSYDFENNLCNRIATIKNEKHITLTNLRRVYSDTDTQEQD